MKPTVLVTGANGHIGASTVRSLLRRGYDVVPFVRQTSDLRSIERLGLDCRVGDVRDANSLLEAMRGCDVVIHHAAVYRLWARKPAEIIQPAVEGTRNVLDAARRNGVQRVVYTSSIVAVGYASSPDRLRTAGDWNDDARSPYFIAKTQSEREASRLSQEYGIPMVTLCPGVVLGPYDFGLTPSTREVLDFIHGRQPSFEGGTNYVHVADVGEVHAMAVTIGDPGGRYIVGGDNLHMRDVASLITRLTGVRPKHMSLTGWPAEMVGAALGLVARFSGISPPFTRELAQDAVGRYGYFDCSATNHAFGIVPRGAEEVLRDAIRWLLFTGRIRSELARRLSPDFSPDPEW